jgi:peptidoglycan/LPS O-acetylase OafA/YrhL
VTGSRIAHLFEAGGDSRIPALDGVRGVAILLVFCVHYFALFGVLLRHDTLSTRAGQFLHDLGYYGVDLFFVLSGYLIYGRIIKGRSTYRHFLRRRIERIYPVFLSIFALYLLLSVAVPEKSKLPHDGLSAFLLANAALLPGMVDIQPVITVAWSLSYEMTFYLLAPIIVVMFKLREWPAARRAQFWLGATVICFTLSWLDLFPRPSLAMFLPGMLLFDWKESARYVGTVSRRAELGTGAFILLSLPFASVVEAGLFLPSYPRWSPFAHLVVHMGLVGLAGFLLLWLALVNSSRMNCALCWKPLRWLGNISYTYYLLHGLVVNALAFVLFLWLRPPITPIMYWGLMLLCLGGSIVASALCYLAIERPIQERMALRHARASRHCPAGGAHGIGVVKEDVAQS